MAHGPLATRPWAPAGRRDPFARHGPASDKGSTAFRAGQVSVFFDGACPLCAREVAFYQRRKGADSVAWVDISRCPGDDIVPGLSRDRALARLHVVNTEGRLVSGGAAFAALWAALPAFRPLGRVFQVAPMTGLLEGAYGLFLKVRPIIQRFLPPKACP